MPIKVPNLLPARETLENENIFVMTENRAMHQDIRPLKLLILNLMPTKIVTETQLLRKLSNTPLQIEVEFLKTISHTASHIDPYHMDSFYVGLDEIKDKFYDGFIITGAPLELVDFSEIDYWDELCEIMDWSTQNAHCTLHLCWGAFAGLHYHFGIEKHILKEKISGIYPHVALKPNSPIFRGFDDVFFVPQSRYLTLQTDELDRVHNLEILAVSDETGPCIVKTEDSRQFFVTGHFEYDSTTLKDEYERDLAKGLNPKLPEHYFPDDNPNLTPKNTWRSAGQLFYTNWLNYYVYQTTPYELTKESIKSSQKFE